MPKPLSQIGDHYKVVVVTPDATLHQSDLASSAMRILASWSEVDTIVTFIACDLLKAEFEKVTLMLQAINSDNARTDAITAAAKFSLSPEKFDLFDRVMKRNKKARKYRNHFAHHVWAIIPDLPFDAIGLIDPKDMAMVLAQYAELIGTHIPADAPPPSGVLPPGKVVVWTEQDMDEVNAVADKAKKRTQLLRFALSENPGSDEARSQLTSSLTAP